MKYFNLLFLLLLSGCLSTKKPLKEVNQKSIKLETKGYFLELEHKCPKTCKACEKLKLTIKSKKTNQGKTISGGECYPKSDETKNFKGFIFQDKLGKYYVFSNGLFQIVDPCGNIQVEEEWILTK